MSGSGRVGQSRVVRSSPSIPRCYELLRAAPPVASTPCFEEVNKPEEEQVYSAKLEDSFVRCGSFLAASEESVPERQLPHTRRLILSSNGTRQFEFHPQRADTVLAGRKDGVVAVINHEDTLFAGLSAGPEDVVGPSMTAKIPAIIEEADGSRGA
eukprot:g730.t1